MTDGAAAAVSSGPHTGANNEEDFALRPDRKAVYSPALSRFPGLVHASTTRTFQAGLPPNFSRLDELQGACDLLGPGTLPLFLGEQKHTNNVAIISPELIDRARQSAGHKVHHTFPSTDALVSAHGGVALAIQTADCAPVFLYDPTARVIGLAHAGWKGTLQGIVEKTVTEMTRLGARAENIRAWLGPMAGGCCYEVSPEMLQEFAQTFDKMPREAVYQGRNLNLVNINVHQLQNAGLSPANIHQSGICTIDRHAEFFSYRADKGTTGRILSLIAMQGD